LEENLEGAAKKGIEVLIPDPHFRQRDGDFEGRKAEKGKERFDKEDYKYDEEKKGYLCPQGKV
jgi:hypothetical protein